jgi:uncharacterized membrane-anchored protein
MARTLHLGYARGSAILVTILLCVFATWRFSTGSLSVDHVKTRKAELFYWIAILFSNTLGTALGDFLADSSGLGFAGGAALIGSLLAIVHSRSSHASRACCCSGSHSFSRDRSVPRSATCSRNQRTVEG